MSPRRLGCRGAVPCSHAFWTLSDMTPVRAAALDKGIKQETDVMLKKARGMFEIAKVSGLNGLWRLFSHAGQIKKYGRGVLLMDALLALEKCRLNELLLSDAGLDVTLQKDFDRAVLSTICDYICETNVLTRI